LIGVLRVNYLLVDEIVFGNQNTPMIALIGVRIS